MTATAAGGAYQPSRLLRAELLKVRSTRMWLGLLVGAVLYVVLQVVSLYFVSLSAESVSPGLPTLESAAGVRSLYSGAGSTYLFTLVVGILGMTQEFRFQTATGAFLAVPRRGRLVAAKMAAYAMVGAGYALVGLAVGYLLALALLAFTDHAPIEGDMLVQIAGGAVLGAALYAVLGVAVGTLVRNQIAALLGALVWVLLVEALLVAFLPALGKWLPGGALSGVLQTTGFNNATYLPAWASALLLLGYALALAAAATATTLRRDIS